MKQQEDAVSMVTTTTTCHVAQIDEQKREREVLIDTFDRLTCSTATTTMTAGWLLGAERRKWCVFVKQHQHQPNSEESPTTTQILKGEKIMHSNASSRDKLAHEVVRTSRSFSSHFPRNPEQC
jgi:hypothetical protein